MICSALIAKAFYKAGISIQPPTGPNGPAGKSGRFHIRHPSYIMPRDFDLSASFQIIKVPTPGLALETPAPWD